MTETVTDEPGPRLERFIRTALANHATVHNITELSAATRLQRNTFYDWFKRRDDPMAATPSPESAMLVCRALDVPLAHFWDAWQGREPEPSSIEEALRRHTDAVETQNGLLRVLMSALHDGALSVTLALTPSDEEGRARKMAKAAIDAEQRESGEGGGRRPANWRRRTRAAS